MIYGLTKNQLDLLYQICIEPLKAAGAQVWIFGSRARGDHRKTSDIDLLYQSESLPKNLIPEIKDSLEESRLPYKVDLVCEQELAASYKDSVYQERKKL